jgi:TRAP-type mannitol/chloroaromatic compound transport system permease large subunit
VLILLGDQISNAYVEAQREIGNWSPEPVSVGDLFAGAIIPGFTLVGLYILYQIFLAWWKPETSPPIPTENLHRGRDFYWKVLSALIPPLVLIVAVLGSILMGIATPTEAAGVGAIGASLLASSRIKTLNLEYVVDYHRNGLYRLLHMIEGRGNISVKATISAFVVLMLLVLNFDMRLGRDEVEPQNMVAIVIAMIACFVIVWGLLIANWRLFASGLLRPIMNGTLDISCLVFVILIGATLFSLVFRGLGGDEAVKELLLNLPGGEFTAVAIVMLVMFLLGFFLDFIEITFVVVPVVAPIRLQTDSFSPVWLGLMMAMNLQTSFLTPPFGFALFYLRGVAPKQVKTQHIYRGVMPFIVIQLIGLGLLAVFPEMADWLPRVIFDTQY